MLMPLASEVNWTPGCGFGATKAINALHGARRKRFLVAAQGRRTRDGNTTKSQKAQKSTASSNKGYKRSNRKVDFSANSGQKQRLSKGFGSGFNEDDGNRDGSKDKDIASILESVLHSDSMDDQDNETDGPFAPENTEELTDTEFAEVLGIETSPADALEGVYAEVEAALEAAISSFHFPLDPFQVKAVRHIIAGRSVVVCAPTGAGKTAIAEGATKHFMGLGGKVIYTTPLKALSNQKLFEMRETFGNENVGLQTGDASINPEGRVVVMTTEILRNMLYRTPDDAGGGVDVRLADVKLVVFDECHYLGDPSRGSVWEECIINLPRDILILAMSATVRNPADVCGWIALVHGTCDMVTTSFRPVPLTWHFCFAPNGVDAPAKLLPLLNKQRRAINPVLLPPHIRFASQKQSDEESKNGNWERIDFKPESRNNSLSVSMRTLNELLGSVDGLDNDGDGEWFRRPRAERVPSVVAVVDILRQKSMLPAIWFIFSRKECDAAVQNLASTMPETGLTNAEERELILKRWAPFRRINPRQLRWKHSCLWQQDWPHIMLDACLVGRL